MEVFDFLSDEDEEFVEIIDYERRPYTVRQRKDPFNDFDDEDFFRRFRLSKPTVLMVLEQIEGEIETPTDRNHSISPINQLLMTLRFYATGSFLITIGDFLNVSKSSACNVIKKVTRVLASLNQRYIKMPENEEEIGQLRLEFYQIARMPRVIGSIDCTHIKIQSPGGEHAELFRNRKGYFSLNVQTISSANLKIMDIVARWPGSTHDQIIFDNSYINHRIHNNDFGDSLIVADSGYANTNHVLTPLLRAVTDIQQLYNESVRRTRNAVERQYGVMKRRFPVLALGVRLKMETVMNVIIACAVLHNIALQQNEEMPPYDDEILPPNIDFDEDIAVDPPEQQINFNARDVLLNDYFPRLYEEH